jgi:PAS domain S-box-containing protein
MRIQTKIILLISVVALSVGILSSILVGRPLLRGMESDTADKGTILAQTLSELIANNVINHEVLPVREAITDVMQGTNDLEYIYVVGFDGSIIAHTFKGGFPRDLADELREKLPGGTPVFRRFLTENGPVLDVGYSLVSGMRGRIHIGLNQTHNYEQISIIRRRIIGTTFVIVALGVLVGIILSRRITRPLGRLAGSMDAFGEGKAGEEIVARSGGWEVAQLARSFNRMTAERKHAEDALRESEERYRLFFESNPQPMWVYDLKTLAFLAVNDAAAEHYGYSREEFLSMTLKDIRPAEDIPALLDNVSKVTEGIDKAGVWKHRKKEGTLIDVEITSHSLIFGGKRAEVVLAYDVTERRRLEQELVKAEKLESIGILAGGIAHDFNNLLTAILGNISLAKMYSPAGSKTYERLSDAEKASLRARDLTQQLLTFSKGGAPVKKTMSIRELISDSACFSLRGSGATCAISIADDLLSVDADEGQISQVMNNLVINARQAMPNGGMIQVRCENVSIEPDDQSPVKRGTYVRISVSDEGVGIPKENLKEIFEPFFTTKPKGSGLGLATSYSIVKNHGGRITVESRVGVGTTFHVYLPASEQEGQKRKQEAEMPSRGSGRILFMDDDEVVRDVAGEMLTNLGYDVEFAHDGAQAIELYTKAIASGRRFDGVITDLTVPGGMGGKEAVKKLRELDPAAKVIVSSGYSNDPIMADFRTYGFSGVVSKPYTMKNLSETVYALVAKGRG